MDEITKLYRVRKTSFEMLRDRGYDIQEEEYTKTFDQFKNDFEFNGSADRKRMQINAVNRDDTTQTIGVIFHENDLKQSDITKYQMDAEKMNLTNVIVVVQGACSSSVKKSIDTVDENRISWEIMAEDDLIINVTKHVLVPEHIKLSKEEGDELLKKYKVKKTQLPRMLLDDPISKYYGFRRGDIVKIIRKSETAGRYVTYRAVF